MRIAILCAVSALLFSSSFLSAPVAASHDLGLPPSLAIDPLPRVLKTIEVTQTELQQLNSADGDDSVAQSRINYLKSRLAALNRIKSSIEGDFQALESEGEFNSAEDDDDDTASIASVSIDAGQSQFEQNAVSEAAGTLFGRNVAMMNLPLASDLYWNNPRNIVFQNDADRSGFFNAWFQNWNLGYGSFNQQQAYGWITSKQSQTASQQAKDQLEVLRRGLLAMNPSLGSGLQQQQPTLFGIQQTNFPTGTIFPNGMLPGFNGLAGSATPLPGGSVWTPNGFMPIQGAAAGQAVVNFGGITPGSVVVNAGTQINGVSVTNPTGFNPLNPMANIPGGSNVQAPVQAPPISSVNLAALNLGGSDYWNNAVSFDISNVQDKQTLYNHWFLSWTRLNPPPAKFDAVIEYTTLVRRMADISNKAQAATDENQRKRLLDAFNQLKAIKEQLALNFPECQQAQVPFVSDPNPVNTQVFGGLYGGSLPSLVPQGGQIYSRLPLADPNYWTNPPLVVINTLADKLNFYQQWFLHWTRLNPGRAINPQQEYFTFLERINDCQVTVNQHNINNFLDNVTTRRLNNRLLQLTTIKDQLLQNYPVLRTVAPPPINAYGQNDATTIIAPEALDTMATTFDALTSDQPQDAAPPQEMTPPAPEQLAPPAPSVLAPVPSSNSPFEPIYAQTATNGLNILDINLSALQLAADEYWQKPVLINLADASDRATFYQQWNLNYMTLWGGKFGGALDVSTQYSSIGGRLAAAQASLVGATAAQLPERVNRVAQLASILEGLAEAFPNLKGTVMPEYPNPGQPIDLNKLQLGGLAYWNAPFPIPFRNDSQKRGFFRAYMNNWISINPTRRWDPKVSYTWLNEEAVKAGVELARERSSEKRQLLNTKISQLAILREQFLANYPFLISSNVANPPVVIAPQQLLNVRIAIPTAPKSSGLNIAGVGFLQVTEANIQSAADAGEGELSDAIEGQNEEEQKPAEESKKPAEESKKPAEESKENKDIGAEAFDAIAAPETETDQSPQIKPAKEDKPAPGPKKELPGKGRHRMLGLLRRTGSQPDSNTAASQPSGSN